MKESRVLKIVSYVLLPVLIGILILSIVSMVGKDSTYYSEEKYFSSEEFVEEYMITLGTKIDELIYENINYDSIYDGEIRICYRL